jgi:hypothetical protein
MKKLIFLILIFAVVLNGKNLMLEISSNSSITKENYATTYVNENFNFKMALPKGVFKKEPIKSDNYGATFESLDAKATLDIVFVKSLNSLKEIYKNIIKKVKNSANLKLGFYKFFGKWYVVSALNLDEDLIYYQKGFKKGNFHIFYILTYPKSQKNSYDRVIKFLNKNFGPISKQKNKQGYKNKIKGGPWCDNAYRTCSLECFDKPNEEVCLKSCERELDRCYKSGRFK